MWYIHTSVKHSQRLPYKRQPSKRLCAYYPPQPRETHAMRYWEEAMEERKAQQGHLSQKLKRSPERLAMNQGDSYRLVQEERYV